MKKPWGIFDTESRRWVREHIGKRIFRYPTWFAANDMIAFMVAAHTRGAEVHGFVAKRFKNERRK